MRLTIAKRKKYKKKQRQKIIIIVLILAPIVSIVLGYIVAKNIILPYWGKDERAIEKTQENNETVDNEPISLNGIEIYSVELAKYKSLDEAKEFIVQLNESGSLGYISQGTEYIVYASLTLDREKVESQERLITEKYPKAISRSILTDKKELDIDKSEKSIFKDMKHTVKLLNRSYKSELDIWIKDVEKIDYDDLKNKIDENNKTMIESMKKYSENFKSGDIKSKDLKELHIALDKSIESRKKASNEFNSKNIEDIRKVYYDFVESLFNYIKYYKI